ncbi:MULTISPECIES: hypothetical protein [Limnospira]|uniref:Uncharacterized protein n=1 Tax=Limnospira fusiformis PMC 851.14 TaxID=2219512 RepID=A0ABU9EK65_LIMFS|nr:hypothetical protein [Limnospira indica]MDT9235057.1 hypothetical protein [Limnospira sp. PMC 917.15]
MILQSKDRINTGSRVYAWLDRQYPALMHGGITCRWCYILDDS